MSGAEALERLLGGTGRGGPRAGVRKSVAVPLANDPEILGCIARAMGSVADFVLIGEEREIRRQAAGADLELFGARFLAATGEVEACALAARLVREGEADLLMKGQVQTATFTRSILDRENDLVAPGRLVSHVTVCGLPAYPRLLFITDAGINVDPTAEQKVEILRNALEVARLLGWARPKVACVAPVEKVSPKVRSTVEAAAVCGLARSAEAALGELEIQGPLGLDVAVCPEAARTKGVSGPVAGQADILLMPGLDAANVLYKSLTCFAGAVMASVMAGARVPVVLTSRADSEQTKYLSLSLALTLARGRAGDVAGGPG